MFPFLRFHFEKINDLISCKKKLLKHCTEHLLMDLIFFGKYWRCEWRLSKITWLLFNTLKRCFCSTWWQDQQKYFLFCQIPPILCNTHLPFQSLPATQLSILRMPNSVHCNESLAAQYHLRHSFSATGRFISSSISKYWGKRTVLSSIQGIFLFSIFFSNSIQVHQNPFVLKLTNEHKHRQAWFIPNNRIISTVTMGQAYRQGPCVTSISKWVGNLTSVRTPLPNDRTAEELLRFVVSEVLPDI